MPEHQRRALPRLFRGDSLLIKGCLLILLTVAMLVPLDWVHGVVAERAELSHEVQAELGATWGTAQRLAGPLLAVPFRWQEVVQVRNKRFGADEPDFLEKTEERDALLYLLPEDQAMTAAVETQTRKRGIYEALLYSADIAVEGRFQIPEAASLDLPEDALLLWDEARLLVHVSDLRGSTEGSDLTWGAQSLTFEVAQDAPTEGSWIETAVPDLAPGAGPIAYRFTLGLNGSNSLALVPMGRSSTASLAMDWPHPSFGGSHLPTESRIGGDGTAARWSLSHLARDLPSSLRSDLCAHKTIGKHIAERGFETRLVDPVDFYLKAERAVKYGLLFIVLTFATLLTFEVTAAGGGRARGGRRLHFVQYALVALALTLFFLLFLSLAEVLGFAPAFWLATLLDLGLISLYSIKATGSLRRGLTLGGALLGIYGYLFFTLRSEDHALLMGSLLLFALLAAMMFATRNVDWFKLGDAAADETPAQET